MAGLNRRFTLVAAVLPFLFVVMSGLARANIIVVNTTDGESDLAPLCTLPDAVAAHNSGVPVNGCAAGSGDDIIIFSVTGTITIDEPLEITNGSLVIQGPAFGCSSAGSCGIVISGGGTTQIIVADTGTIVFLDVLTLTNGFAAPGTAGGGAIFANGTDLGIFDSLLVNNQAEGPVPIVGGRGGAIFGESGTIEITNSTLANNTAVPSILPDSFGGAIFSFVPLKITNTTISGNSAIIGGGIEIGLTAFLKGTILSSNTGGNCGGTPFDVGFNISSDATCSFLLGSHSLNSTDPILGPLENNGGPTETFALLAGSPAIDRIPVASCTDQEATPLPLVVDQRLFARPDAANLFTCDSGAYEFAAKQPLVLVPKTEHIQIARSTTDQVNLAFSFIDNGPGTLALCDSTTNALNGVSVDLFEGTCASIPSSGLDLDLTPFVVRKVNGQSYGTLFQMQPNPFLQQPMETVSARIVQLGTPEGSCGEWTLNIQVAGLNTSSIGLGGGNPFALVLDDVHGNEACFDITNAIVGSQIPTSTPKVRRGVRR
jgi:hypothetical protein